jgi:WD40 repeat protein
MILLSGGQVDRDLKVWNSETGQQIASLKGHNGDINSIKMATDGSFAISVGTDNRVLIFDIRASKAVGSMDARGMSEMHEVALSSQSSSLEGTM